MLDLSDKHNPAVAAHALAAAQTLEAPPLDSSPAAGRRYRHYKGGLYEVTGRCVVEATKEAGVLYRAVDPLQQNLLYMRPLGDFSSPVGSGGQLRFALLHEPAEDSLRHFLPPQVLPEASLTSVLQWHAAPGRFYHSPRHVLRAFERAQEYTLLLTPEQCAALLFQRIAFLPGAPDEVCARLSCAAMSETALRLNFFDAQAACRLVEEACLLKPTSRDAAIICDLNQAVLAEDAVEFCAADELLWLENRHLLDRTHPRKDFDTRRLKFLLSRVEAGPLFSDECRHLETPARNNIEALRQAWVAKYGKDKKG